MPLQFPHVPDLRLTKAPLAEVVCQVRFPAILKIEKETPSDFQEEVRHRFPVFEVEQGIQVRMAAPVAPTPPEAQITPRIYRFRTADGQSYVTLTVDSYALTTNRYTVWEEFAHDLNVAHDAAQAVYGLPFATRIGLRYVNVFGPSETGYQTLTELGQLLRPELTCLLSTDGWSAPNELLTQLLLDDQPARLAMRVGAKHDDGSGSPVLFLDLDYFEEGQLPIEEVAERCQRYHDVIYWAFRWALNDELLAVFAPEQGGK